jgi:hypothetical protein
MSSLIAAILGLFVLFAIGPMLGRAVVRLLHRVPAIGAVATLGLFFLYTEAPDNSELDPPAPGLFHITTSDTPAWSPDHRGQVHTTDEDMPDVYRAERLRYAHEIEAVKDAVSAWIQS